MHADLDTLCTVVCCTADDLLPEACRNARWRVTDAEIVTLCVAQAIMDSNSKDVPKIVGQIGPGKIVSVRLLRRRPGPAGRWRLVAVTVEAKLVSNPLRS